MRILVIGQCSLQWGRMEFGNLGNHAISEVLFRELRAEFIDAEIRTTFQMSNEFCDRHKVSVLPMKLYYGWTKNDFWYTIYELAAAYIWKIIRFDRLLTRFMKEVIKADLIIDFSGDIWGNNASLIGRNRFFVGIAKDHVAQIVGKPIVMIAGSPGPFNSNIGKLFAKRVYKRFAIVTNREPLSTKYLKKNHFSMHRTITTACPAFLFDFAVNKRILKIIEKEGLNTKTKPIIGFVLCGWNMPVGPYTRWPREEWEYNTFVQAIKHVLNTFNAQICLLSHNHAFSPSPNFELFPGRDAQLLRDILERLKKDGYGKDVFMIKGAYDCWATKAIVSNFDMLISGRIHAAVSALSQYIPTVIIDYGHEPKAHKLRGFAEVCGVLQFLASPTNSSELIQKIDLCWRSRLAVREHLRRRIPKVRELSKKNFKILRQLVL